MVVPTVTNNILRGDSASTSGTVRFMNMLRVIYKLLAQLTIPIQKTYANNYFDSMAMKGIASATMLISLINRVVQFVLLLDQLMTTMPKIYSVKTHLLY